MGSQVMKSLEDGGAVEIPDLFARLNDLEDAFEDRGFVHVAVNDWLLTALDGDPEAREFMVLRSLAELVGDREAGSVARGRDVPDGAESLGAPDTRYAPDGMAWFVPAAPARRP